MDNNEQGKKFLEETGTKLTLVYVGRRILLPEDKEIRDVWHFVLSSARGVYGAEFGNSIDETRKGYKRGYPVKPSAYYILACLTKYEPEKNVDDFAEEFGYTKPSEAIRTYNAVLREWEGVQKVFTAEQIEKMQEIC